MTDAAIISRAAEYFQAAVAARPQSVSRPRFWIRVDEDDVNPFRNYALPVTGAEPSDADIDDLVDAFASLKRVPRLEFIEDATPALEQRLLARGFTREGRLPLLALGGAGPQRALFPNGADATLPTHPADLHQAAIVQNAAYGEGAAGQMEVSRLATLLGAGGFVALVRDANGTPVASGLASPPLSGVTEVAAIGVVERARGKGYGAAVASFIASEALRRGIDLPLVMADEAEARMYRRIGYVTAGHVVHVSKRCSS